MKWVWSMISRDIWRLDLTPEVKLDEIANSNGITVANREGKIFVVSRELVDKKDQRCQIEGKIKVMLWAT